MEKYLSICALALTTVGAFTDLRDSRIPNWLTYGGLLLAVGARAMLGWHGLLEGLTGALVGGGLLCVLFLIGGMGGGDVKMMAAVGAWVGLPQTQSILIATAISGGIIAVIYILFRGKFLRTLWNTVELLRHHLTSGLKQHPALNIHSSGTIRVPFGLAIAMGTWYCVGNAIWWR